MTVAPLVLERVEPPVARPQPDAWARTVRQHALGWLVAANAVGVWLALLLVWPDAGRPLGALTYGRWMPLHLNWQLYGWCSLPLVGALLRFYAGAGPRDSLRPPTWPLLAWSAALAAGGASWLAGITSGKLFLDWHGWARPLLPGAMAVLWIALARAAWVRRREGTRVARAVRLALLGVLAPVPLVLFWASGRGVYPAVNPHSGGATGASLLASTLGVVGIFSLLPRLLGRSLRPTALRPAVVGAVWLASWAVYAVLDHGSASHHSAAQVAGLAVLFLWIPLLPRWLAGFDWSPASRRWLRAAAGWWAVLVLSGWVLFLPGLNERLKFTNALVAHAHLAMAGLVTSLHFVLLNELDPARPLRRGLGWWQAGCAAHVVVLTALGWFEHDHAAGFFAGAPWVTLAYGFRLVAGAVMLAGSVLALREAAAS